MQEIGCLQDATSSEVGWQSIPASLSRKKNIKETSLDVDVMKRNDKCEL